MATRLTITQTKTGTTPANTGFFSPSSEFTTIFQTYIDDGSLTEVQNSISGDIKTSIIDFVSIEKFEEFNNLTVVVGYRADRLNYNTTNNIIFTTVTEEV
tara:strand:+ start:26 stop:325 length:300 start_codon:yes stop_codon:yes gene_type:complete